ncbi:hypothetical protein QFC22_006303 [Naganishia vaughanmartiniae]|uniref:Uncharacterized protein n=1 Tax=Naganishia vaughanmartiniae TaxID=1424756 RepID=A0ACC2WLX0_9TREE|nr:hypothetical protein QFC22_006303 [Naganishia vaughanmartiniae]
MPPPFLPSGSYMGMNISGTSFAPMSYIGASYTGRQPGLGTGGGGMSVSPGGWSVGMGGFAGPSGSSVSARPMGINGMAPAQRTYPHQPYPSQQQQQPMNSFGNMGSYLGRGSLNVTSGGFSLSNSGYGLPYGASLTHPTQQPHAASSASSHQGPTTAGPVGGAGMSVGVFAPPGMGGTGGERSRELEAKFVKDFMCCGLRLNGLHDLLEQ